MGGAPPLHPPSEAQRCCMAGRGGARGHVARAGGPPLNWPVATESTLRPAFSTSLLLQ
jgi:hypothetical protein